MHNFVLIKRILHLILIIIANILFFGSHFYCDYKTYGVIEPSKELLEAIDSYPWWVLRCNLYALTFLDLVLASYLPKHKFSFFWMAFLVGLSISDVIDRTYFNINTFTVADRIMLVVNLVLSLVMSKGRNRVTKLKSAT